MGARLLNLGVVLHRGLVRNVHPDDLTMRSLAVFFSLALLSGCGNSQIVQTSQAREQPTIEAVQPASVPRDSLALPNDSR